MTIQTIASALRRTFPQSMAGISPHPVATGEQHCASRLSTTELRQLVATMVD
jgi:hypothetical protein